MEWLKMCDRLMNSTVESIYKNKKNLFYLNCLTIQSRQLHNVQIKVFFQLEIIMLIHSLDYNKYINLDL